MNFDQIVNLTKLIEILSLLGGAIIGAATGLAIAIVVVIVLKIAARSRGYLGVMANRVRTPWAGSLLFIGAYFGIQNSAADLKKSGLAWIDVATHILIIIIIILFTWLCVRLARVLEDLAVLRCRDREAGYASRVKTQAQVLRRVLQAVFICCGIAGVAFTFPQARLAMGAVFASAGVISVVAGLAAQSSLANIFAGVQLAITDAIRVGDIVSIPSLDGKTTQGTIEEITMTYVVVRVWDDRRIVVPSTIFTQQKFENLTRRHAQMLGSVELDLDWQAPVASIRREVDRLLHLTDLWDGRTSNVQVIDSTPSGIRVRVAVSSKNSATLWDLRCYLREHLVEWILLNAPEALPRTRIEPQEVNELEIDPNLREAAKLAEELSGIAGPASSLSAPGVGGEIEAVALAQADYLPPDGGSASIDQTQVRQAQSPVHQARVQAARKRSIRAIARRSLIAKGRNSAVQNDNNDAQVDRVGGAGTNADKTVVLSPERLPASAEVFTTGERLYSGSQDADERAQIFAGPGEEVLADRERAVQKPTVSRPAPASVPADETPSATAGNN